MKLVVNSSHEVESSSEFDSEVDSEKAMAVAVEPTAGGHVFVIDGGGKYVSVCAPSGPCTTPIEKLGEGEFGLALGVAFNAAVGDLYVTDATRETVHIFEEVKAFKAPVVVVKAPEGPTPEGVTLKGSVNPEGEEGTNWYFAWGETDAYGSKTPLEEVPKGSAPVPVTATLSGLVPNTTYHYQLFAYNKHDKTKPVGSGDETFMTPVIPPVVSGEPASFIATKAATLVAKIDPEHSATTFHFEYGASQAYGHETPEESAGSAPTSGFVSHRSKDSLLARPITSGCSPPTNKA